MAKEKITNSASHVLWSAVFSHEDKCQTSAVLVYNHILLSANSYAGMGIFVEPRSKILETLYGKFLVPKEGFELSPAPRAGDVPMSQMELGGSPCAALECLSSMDLPLQSVRHGTAFPMAATPNSTCIFPVEIIMPF